MSIAVGTVAQSNLKISSIETEVIQFLYLPTELTLLPTTKAPVLCLE